MKCGCQGEGSAKPVAVGDRSCPEAGSSGLRHKEGLEQLDRMGVRSGNSEQNSVSKPLTVSVSWQLKAMGGKRKQNEPAVKSFPRRLV